MITLAQDHDCLAYGWHVQHRGTEHLVVGR
jgi:hypothetical protein